MLNFSLEMACLDKYCYGLPPKHEFCRNFLAKDVNGNGNLSSNIGVVPLAHMTFELSALILFLIPTSNVSKNVLEMTLKSDPESNFASVVVSPMETGISLSWKEKAV